MKVEVRIECDSASDLVEKFGKYYDPGRTIVDQSGLDEIGFPCCPYPNGEYRWLFKGNEKEDDYSLSIREEAMVNSIEWSWLKGAQSCDVILQALIALSKGMLPSTSRNFRTFADLFAKRWKELEKNPPKELVHGYVYHHGAVAGEGFAVVCDEEGISEQPYRFAEIVFQEAMLTLKNSDIPTRISQVKQSVPLSNVQFTLLDDPCCMLVCQWDADSLRDEVAAKFLTERI